MKRTYLRIIIIAGVSALALCIAVFFFTHDRVTPEETSPNELLLQQKDTWRKLMKEQNTEAVYAEVLAEAAAQPRMAHAFMHLIGELLYEEDGLQGLGVCDGAFGFGCYHGFFNAAIYAEGIEILPELDAACIAQYGTEDTRCQHGLGHGILVYTGYENLIDALSWCATLPSQFDGSCSSGVFMEYNFHTMEAPSGDYYRPLNDDVYAPCPQLPDQFQASCYMEQTLLWGKHFNNDFAKMGSLCAALVEGSAQKDACYQGVGDTISEQTNYAYDEIIKYCGMMQEGNPQALCREGASWQLIGRGGADREAYMRLCESLGEAKRDHCLSRLDSW